MERALPEGLLADAQWLEQRGYYRSLRSQYVASGWLEQPARGVFRRPRGTVSWEQVVISLQTLLEFPVSVGWANRIGIARLCPLFVPIAKNHPLIRRQKITLLDIQTGN